MEPEIWFFIVFHFQPTTGGLSANTLSVPGQINLTSNTAVFSTVLRARPIRPYSLYLMRAEHIQQFCMQNMYFLFHTQLFALNSFQIKGRQRNEVKQMLTVCMTSSLNVSLLRMSPHATYKYLLISCVSQPDASCKQRQLCIFYQSPFICENS